MLLVLVGAAPAILGAVLLQIGYANRRGWLAPGGRHWAAVLLGLTVLLAVPAIVALWAGLPRWTVLWIGFSAPWPQELFGVLLLPSILGVVFASLLARWFTRRLEVRAAA